MIPAEFLHDDVQLDLARFARSCGTTTTFIEALVLEGVLEMRADAFRCADIARVRKVLRVQRDFEAPLSSAAVIVQLMEELERLRAALQGMGTPR